MTLVQLQIVTLIAGNILVFFKEELRPWRVTLFALSLGFGIVALFKI